MAEHVVKKVADLDYRTPEEFVGRSTGYAGDKPLELAKNKPAFELADFKNEGAALVQPTIRKNFKDTAFWQPDVITGADGRATVKVDLPDNLTTWRATARLTADWVSASSSAAFVKLRWRAEASKASSWASGGRS